VNIITDQKSDKRYVVIAIIAMKKNINVDQLRKSYNADIIFSKANRLYLCKEIINAEFQDLPNTEKLNKIE